jgi:hypothetical protein
MSMLSHQVAVVRLPRLTHNLAAPAKHVVDECTVDVLPIDQQLVDGDPCRSMLIVRDGMASSSGDSRG